MKTEPGQTMHNVTTGCSDLWAQCDAEEKAGWAERETEVMTKAPLPADSELHAWLQEVHSLLSQISSDAACLREHPRIFMSSERASDLLRRLGVRGSKPRRGLPGAPGSTVASDTLQTDRLATHQENQRLRAALERIRSFPVHSEPVGGAYAMQDIAHEALTPNAELRHGAGE